MILSGKEIKKQIDLGEIYIDPFDEKKLNPNSYNVCLGNKLLTYPLKGLSPFNEFLGFEEYLDIKKQPKTKTIIIPEDGFVLLPGNLYLGRTLETTKTRNFVPMLEGRSSIGRLGMFIHITAGFGDSGFGLENEKGSPWTLEIFVVHPLKVYPGIEIAQIFYHTIQGEIDYYRGKYSKASDVEPSFLSREFE
jgi:dCTP deaminase